jgi:type IV secretory pathway component VirB8
MVIHVVASPTPTIHKTLTFTHKAIVKIMKWKFVFGRKKYVRNDFRNSANLYTMPHHSPSHHFRSISGMIPKNIIDLQFGRLLK